MHDFYRATVLLRLAHAGYAPPPSTLLKVPTLDDLFSTPGELRMSGASATRSLSQEQRACAEVQPEKRLHMIGAKSDPEPFRVH